jgi:aspartate racemase
MKTIGLIGGMSWESTSKYYSIINQETNRRLGRLNSAQIVLYSVNFDPLERAMSKERWDQTADALCKASAKLMAAGANCILLCTNTMHMNAEDVRRSVSIPFIHIADATYQQIKDVGYKKAALLGTMSTMKEDFLKSKFIEKGLDIILPEETEMQIIHDIIFKELCKGIITEDSKDMYLQIIDNLAERGAECVIFGCTEIGLLINIDDCPIPAFDTTEAHALAAVDFALGKHR